MTESNVIDRFFDGLTSGDIELSRACFAPGARLWHGFDRIALDVDTLIASFVGMIEVFPERRIEDVRRQPTPSGFVQQHLMVVKRGDGTMMAWPVCIVVRTQDGLIARLDEYIDRAGSFVPCEGAVVTPGF